MRVVLALLLVLLAPGMLFTLAFSSKRRLHLSHTLGLSLALPPVLALWWDRLGGCVSADLTMSLYALLGVGALWMVYRYRRSHPPLRWHAFPFVLGGLWLLVLLWRFEQSAELVLPAWVDSLHHTQLVQLLVREGRLPRVVPAYDPIPFYYHYGFHLLTATFVRLSGLAEPQAVLVFGQVANALLSLGLYRLTVSVTRSRAAGLLAALLTGFISRFPAYFLSWGRYSLLMGDLLLCLALAQALETWRAPHRTNALVLALLVAGLFLTHYLTTLYFVAFVAFLMAATFAYPARRRGSMLVAGACALACVLTLPWLAHIIPYLDFKAYANTPTHAEWFAAEALVARYRYIGGLFNGRGTWFVAAWAVPTGACLLRRRSMPRLIVLWTLALAFLSQEALFKINPLRADLVAITLYLPGNLLAAYGMVRVAQRLQRWSGGAYATLWQGLMSAALLVWGMGQSVDIVNPVTVLATEADVAAMSWIEQHTPQTAVFLIGATPWQNRIYRGTDGGWWIPLLTGRRTVLPPGIFYSWGDDATIGNVEAVGQQVATLTGCDAAFWELVRAQGVTHIYIGPQGGPLKPAWFVSCAGVELLYQERGVYIYRIR